MLDNTHPLVICHTCYSAQSPSAFKIQDAGYGFCEYGVFAHPRNMPAFQATRAQKLHQFPPGIHKKNYRKNRNLLYGLSPSRERCWAHPGFQALPCGTPSVSRMTLYAVMQPDFLNPTTPTFNFWNTSVRYITIHVEEDSQNSIPGFKANYIYCVGARWCSG